MRPSRVTIMSASWRRPPSPGFMRLDQAHRPAGGSIIVFIRSGVAFVERPRFFENWTVEVPGYLAQRRERAADAVRERIPRGVIYFAGEAFLFLVQHLFEPLVT